MKNYLIINQFNSGKSFAGVYNALKKAFNDQGEKLEILTNVEAKNLIKEEGNGTPVLFWDKDVYLAKLLEKSGYRCVNSAFTIETCDDKAKTYLALLGKVPQPKTLLAPFTFDGYAYSDISFLKDILQDFNFPVVVKENKGSFGAQVYLVNDFSELEKLVLSFGHCDFLIQEFISSSQGKDMRVYVVGGKVVAYALRYNERDFRSNVNNGGMMKKVELSHEYASVAIKACECVQADFAGVDLLIGENGPIVCEVNSNAHFNALAEVTGVDVAENIAKYFLSLKAN